MKPVSIEISCDLNNLGLVRDWFRSNTLNLINDEEIFERLNLALNELLSNVIIHANQSNPEKDLTVCMQITEDAIKIELTHAGIAFNPSRNDLPDIESLPEGGFGLFLISSAFDEVNYYTDPDGTQKIRLARKL
jgi:serine/threonine-protein kinase RsbW